MNDDVTFARLKRYLPVMIMVPALVVALAVGFGVRSLVVTGYGRMVAAGVNGFVLEAYGTQGLAGGGVQSRDLLAQTIEARKQQGNLESVMLKDRTGRVVYSTEDSQIGKVLAPDGASRAALNGTVTTRVIWRDRRQWLSVVSPAQLSQSEQPDGVIVLVRPIGPLRRTLVLSFLALTGTVLLGAGIAWWLLDWLIARTQAELSASRAHVAAVDRRLKDSLAELAGHSVGTLQALTQAVDAKDSYTALHSVNVADYACLLARHLGLDDEVVTLERAGLLHDVGKIGLSEAILQKSAPLSPEEYATVKEHSRVGAEIIASIPFLSEVTPVVLSHHERWDGQGYPEGLRGESIPLGARILAVVDAFDAMTTERSYHGALSFAHARAELLLCRGTHFEPRLVDAFVTLLDAGHLSRPADGDTHAR